MNTYKDAQYSIFYYEHICLMYFFWYYLDLIYISNYLTQNLTHIDQLEKNLTTSIKSLDAQRHSV